MKTNDVQKTIEALKGIGYEVTSEVSEMCGDVMTTHSFKRTVSTKSGIYLGMDWGFIRHTIAGGRVSKRDSVSASFSPWFSASESSDMAAAFSGDPSHVYNAAL
jgi:hypothetical protein